MGRTRLGYIYKGMKSRCFWEKDKDYKNYGARGITVCDEWYSPRKHRGWIAFKKWAYSHGYKEGLTIDRIDNSKGYSPDNCRWVSMKVQNNNRRNNRLITYKNETKTLSQWSEILGVHKNTIRNRLNRGWEVEKAFGIKK